MKKLFTTVMLSFIGLNLFSQVPSTCNVPSVLQTAYNNDVHELAMTRIFQINSPDKNSIIVPQVYKDSIWEGLASIFNAISIPERDSVFDIHCIHANLGPGLPYFYSSIVWVDTSYSWTQAWQNNQLTTGNTQLDNLLASYGFTLLGYSSFSNSATLLTNQQINIYTFNDSLKKFNGIGSVLSATVGDGNSIRYSTNGNNRKYEFTLGYGDCPAGCTSHYTWKFSVLPDCSVLFTGVVKSGNDPFPSPVNCNMTNAVNEQTANINSMQVYPNPGSGKFTLKNNELRITNYTLDIYNVFGEKVFQSAIPNQQSVIDISSQPGGIYFLNIRTEKESFTQKLIIQK